MGSKRKINIGALAAQYRSMNPFMRTLYALNALSFVGGLVYGLYYGTYLYRHTFSLSVLALDGLFGGLGCWLGYLMGVWLIQKYGYRMCFRVAFGLWTTVAAATAIVAGHIAEWFVALAVLRAIPGGLYAANCDTIMLREVTTSTRNNFLQFVLGFEFLVSVVLPSAVGLLVHTGGGYRLAFVAAAGIFALALLVPMALPKPKLRIRLGETLQILRRPLYRQHAANRMAASGFNQLNGFVIMIIPFLLLKDEFKVGILTSIAALVAGIVSLLMRRVKPSERLRAGYAAYGIRALASAMFVLVWTAPFLMLWQLVSKLVTPLHDPLQQGLDIHNDSLIMGEDVKQKALHINLLNNTLLLVGTTVAYGAFFVITHVAGGQQRYVLQLLILGYAAWRFVNLTVSVRINSKASRVAVGSLQPEEEKLSLGYGLRLMLASQLGRLRLLLFPY